MVLAESGAGSWYIGLGKLCRLGWKEMDDVVVWIVGE